MNKEVLDLAVRRVLGAACLLLSAMAFYRAYSYEDPTGPNMIAPFMCVVLALNLAVTGILMAVRAGQREMEPA